MPKAVVLFSGGLDSTTTLAMAQKQGFDCYCLSCQYGQRHVSELDAAKRISQQMGAIEHRIASVDIGQWGGSSLTDTKIDLPSAKPEAQDIPSTYVPARNTVFLALALGWAEQLKATAIFAGMSAVDYSGYPDCRPEYMQAFQNLINHATAITTSGAHAIQLITPLIDLSKAQTIERGIALGVEYSLTVSCYQADAQGRACGVCESCYFRKKGFEEAGVSDPTRYR